MGRGRCALWSSRKGFPSGSPPMVLKGGSEMAACPMGRAAAPWHLPSPCLGPPSESALPPRNGNSCLLRAAGQAEGWKFHTVPSVCVLTFLVRLYEAAHPRQQALPLNSAILSPPKALGGRKRKTQGSSKTEAREKEQWANRGESGSPGWAP